MQDTDRYLPLIRASAAILAALDADRSPEDIAHWQERLREALDIAAPLRFTPMTAWHGRWRRSGEGGEAMSVNPCEQCGSPEGGWEPSAQQNLCYLCDKIWAEHCARLAEDARRTYDPDPEEVTP